MLIVISPAKRLNWDTPVVEMTTPAFSKEAGRLAAHARQLGLGELKKLMGLSDDLARLNRDRFRDFSADPDTSVTRPAIHAFAGDTYVGLDAASMGDDVAEEAQRRLRILSGLYGVLRPRDAIQAYRLEMGSRLKTRRGATLYDFWRGDLALSLNRDAERIGTSNVLNCASQEYFRAVDLNRLRPGVITPQFLEDRNGEGRVIGFFAKRARGALARFVLEHHVKTPDGVRDFDWMGYRFDPATSAPDAPVFRRPYETAAETRLAS